MNCNSNVPKPIVILGAAGTGLLMTESISRNSDNQVLGFLDDDANKQAHGYHDVAVLGGLSSWRDLPCECLFITSLYGPKKNPDFFELIKSLGIPERRWAMIIDPNAIISTTATLGYGTYVGPGTVLEPMVSVGNHCAMLGNVYISHHSCLGDYVVCANSVSIAGGVSVGDVSFIGANATIREYTKIASGAVVGAGSVVIKNVLAGQTVAGNPAHPLRESSRKT
jgi:sugar O-acyltransferase (sialic acid O-acetyltransferase NeuD family)